jgi:hypothetical protein
MNDTSDGDVGTGRLFFTERFLEADLTDSGSKSILSITPIRRKSPFRILAFLVNERSPQGMVKDSMRICTGRQLGTYHTFISGGSRMMLRANFHIGLFPHQKKRELKIAVDADWTWVIGKFVAPRAIK